MLDPPELRELRVGYGTVAIHGNVQAATWKTARLCINARHCGLCHGTKKGKFGEGAE